MKSPTIRRIVLAAMGVSLGVLGMTAPAQAAPSDISPQRVAGAYGPDGLHVFVRGTTGYIYQKVVSPNGQQSNWVMMGTQVASSPAATVDLDGRVYVAARTSNGTILYRWRQPTGAWTGWYNIGGSTYGAPALQAVSGQSMNSPDNQVTIAAQAADGRVQVRQLLWNSTTPARLFPNWTVLDDQHLTAAPNLSDTNDCQAADDTFVPYVVSVVGRSPSGTGIGRALCKPPWTTYVSEPVASSVDSDAERRDWYRGDDGALWANGTRVGTPAAGLRVACSPTVSGYEVPPAGGGPVPHPSDTSILIRDNNGTSWLYTPPKGATVGGTWTNLGGVAT
jgi:hypothetical protein